MDEYIVNISFHADVAIAEEVQRVIDSVLFTMATANLDFSDPIISEILNTPDPAMRSFAFQVKVNSLENADDWLGLECKKFLDILSRRYGGRLLYFITKMKILKQ